MKNKNFKSAISQQLKRRRNIALVVYTLIVFGTLGLSWSLSGFLIWQPEDFIYNILVKIKEYLFILLPVILLLGYVIIINFYWKKIAFALNEIIDSTKLLFNNDGKRIQLSNDLSDIEILFNSLKFEFERNQQVAQEAVRRKNDLIVYLAHDLKTPLTSVIGYLSLINDEDDLSEETRKKYTDVAFRKANRLEELINEFFEITRFNLASFELELSQVNFSLMIEQLLFEFEAVFAKKDLELKTYIQKDVMLSLDIDKMSRAIDNLLINAYNYSFENTKVIVSLVEEHGNIILSVKNKGNTIPQSKLDRIFEQFYRLDDSRASTTGKSGLGLAITKEIVELHDGNISAVSWDEQILFEIKFKK
ncbi:MAG: HAMP domain-containing sensor histidine kinase [Erysipelotrichales bacterium]